MFEQYRISNSLLQRVVVLLAILSLLSFHEALADSSESEETVFIHITDEGFTPQEVTINQGDTVEFENFGKDDHWPASNIHPAHRAYPNSGIQKCGSEEEPGIFDSCRGIAPGESYSFVFEHEGIWRFHDHVYPQFKGKITVKETASSLTQTTSEEPQPESKGFFTRIFEAIKNFFVRLFGFQSDGEEDTLLVSVPPSTPLRGYDESIEEGAPGIFHDQDALYSYIRKFGPAQTTRHLHDLQVQFGDCHQAAHDTGNFAYEIHGAKSFQLCSAECHSGCYHGAAENYFREQGTANLVEDLKIICGSELNPFLSHQCIHGIGHGLMAWADYDIFEALENCDLLPGGYESCYTGVYMENIIGGLAQEQGHFTKYLSDDPHFPCTVVEEKYKSSCYYYQTSRMIQLFYGDFSKVAAACEEIASEHQASCFLSMGRDIGGTFRGNPKGAIATCDNAAEGNPRTWCLSGAVQDSFWDASGQDTALRFCTLLTQKEEKDVCYNTIFSRAPQVLIPQEDMKSFCLKAEEVYQERCLNFIR